MGKILVVGSLNMDMVAQVEQLPREGETVMGADLKQIPGGKGANQCCAAARLGGKVDMLGCVGQDAFGQAILAGLAHAGAGVHAVQQIQQVPTGTALIQVNARGNNSIVVSAGANRCCDIAYLKQCDRFFCESDILLLQMEIPPESVAWAVRRSKEAGKTVILNPAPAPTRLDPALLCHLDYLVPNQTELEKITGLPCGTLDEIAAAANTLLAQGVGCVLVTLGERGVLQCDVQGTTAYAARTVQAVDTTAAGDTFCGALAAALGEGMSLTQAVKRGNLASSLCVTRAGAQDSIPTRDELEDLLQCENAMDKWSGGEKNR